jgi:hypothetical protein
MDASFVVQQAECGRIVPAWALNKARWTMWQQFMEARAGLQQNSGN